MNSTPKISIVIPVYNVEEYIAECLHSVMRQTYTGEIECILVDDCGKDNSIALAEKFITGNKGNISFRILYHKRNRGLSAARNTGTEAATGDYIYYLDSDDYISDDCIETLTKPLSIKDYDLVMGGVQTFGDDKDQKYLFNKADEIIGNETIFSAYADRLLYVMACNKLYKLSCLRANKVTFLEGQLHEDEMWTYKIMSCIDSLAICHSTTYFYRMRGGSIIKTDNLANGRKADAYFETFKYMTQHPYIHCDLYEKVVAYYAKFYLSIAFSSYKPFYAQYKYVRTHFSPKENNHKLGIQTHLSMPIPLGYCYAKIWSRVKKVVSHKI